MRTYILETDRAQRQSNAAARPRSYFQPVHVIEPVSENGTVRLNEVTLRIAHGKDEPRNIGNLNRTKRRIITQNALERVYDDNTKLLGLLMYEERKTAQRSAKQARRANYKAMRQTN